MNRTTINSTLKLSIALVWLTNGLFCKVLGLAPRHEEIVMTALGNNHHRTFTVIIGLLEIAIAIWVLVGKKQKLNALIQIITVASMNIIEFALTPYLLLWGKYNALFAFLFIATIYYYAFYLDKKQNQQLLC